jgi:hypothetical protein
MERRGPLAVLISTATERRRSRTGLLDRTVRTLTPPGGPRMVAAPYGGIESE